MSLLAIPTRDREAGELGPVHLSKTLSLRIRLPDAVVPTPLEFQCPTRNAFELRKSTTDENPGSPRWYADLRLVAASVQSKAAQPAVRPTQSLRARVYIA